MHSSQGIGLVSTSIEQIITQCITIPLIQVGNLLIVGIQIVCRRTLIVEFKVSFAQVEGIGISFCMIHGIQCQHQRLARLHSHALSCSWDHIYSLHRHGFVHDVGCILTFGAGKECRLYKGNTISIESYVRIIGNNDILVFQKLLTLRSFITCEENLRDNKTTLGIEGIHGQLDIGATTLHLHVLAGLVDLGCTCHTILGKTQFAGNGYIVCALWHLVYRGCKATIFFYKPIDGEHLACLNIGEHGLAVAKHHVVDAQRHLYAERHRSVCHTVVVATSCKRQTYCKEHQHAHQEILFHCFFILIIEL